MEKNLFSTTRRGFLKSSTGLAVGASLAGTLVMPKGVHAGTSEKIRIGLIGCGGRGTGAAENALAASPDNVLVAVGDAFEDVARRCARKLRSNEAYKGRVTLEDSHVFSGFDAYKQVVDSGVDLVILAEPPHFRPHHLAYAIDAGKHAFVEKPIAVDAPGVRSVIETCKKAQEKDLAIVSGLCWRYHPAVTEAMKRVMEDKAIGDVLSIQSCYNAGTLWHRGDRPNWSRMEYQIRNWLYFDWLSGDHICEQAVHSLDKTAWVLGDIQPIRAVGTGGRQQRTGAEYGNIYDHHAVFYEYPNNVHVHFMCRQQANTTSSVHDIIVGTKGVAEIRSDACKIIGENAWESKSEGADMYVLEHEALFKSIRDGEPINNGHYMANSSMLAIMGRMCTYSGQDLSWDECIRDETKLGPAEYAWNDDVPEVRISIPGQTDPPKKLAGSAPS